MAHQVIWTRKTLEAFEHYGNLNDFQCKVLETRCKNMTITQQSFELGCSKSTIDKEIKRLKLIYDEVQKLHPDELPVRRVSSKELYMDTH